MAKAHCNIIHDLLPSYVDGITSEESKQMIEEHFRECESCKKVYESLKEHNFVAEKAEVGIAGYIKKLEWKKRVAQRGMLVLVVFLFLLQFFLNFSSYTKSYSLYIVNCIFYPMHVILLLNILGTWKTYYVYSKAEKRILVIEGISFFYMTGMFYSFFIKLENGEMRPYGLPIHQTGPFLERWLIVLMAAYFLIFFAYLILKRRKKTYNQNIIIMLLSGIVIFLNIRVGLYRMVSTLPAIKTVSIYLSVVIIESVLLLCVTRNKL